MATKVAKGVKTRFHDFEAWIEFYGYDAGPSGTGDYILTSLSYQTFQNHACDRKPNFVDVEVAFPWTGGLFDRWNPVASRIQVEIDHLTIAARDIAKGEIITGDYYSFDGFLGCQETDDCSNNEWIERMCSE